jgi:hypothetical protein
VAGELPFSDPSSSRMNGKRTRALVPDDGAEPKKSPQYPHEWLPEHGDRFVNITLGLQVIGAEVVPAAAATLCSSAQATPTMRFQPDRVHTRACGRVSEVHGGYTLWRRAAGCGRWCC